MKIISIIIVFVCLFSYPVIGQEIDVDKEINIVMEKLIQKLEEIGFGELRDSTIEDIKTLRFYYRGLDIARQLNDKKLIREINWFIETTELKIKSNLKFMKFMEAELEEIEKQLRKLLERKKKEERKNKRTTKKGGFFSCFK